MKRIFKYPLKFETQEYIAMPSGASILSVGVQRIDLRIGFREELRLWAHVDDALPPETRTFVVYGTGHQTRDPGNLKFIGTALMADGDYVWHVFEVIKP